MKIKTSRLICPERNLTTPEQDTGPSWFTEKESSANSIFPHPHCTLCKQWNSTADRDHQLQYQAYSKNNSDV